MIRNKKIDLVLNCCGLGDIVHSFPTIRFIFNNNKFGHEFRVFSYFPDLVELFFKPSMDMTGGEYIFKEPYMGFIYFLRYPTTLALHITDYASIALADRLLDDKNFPIAPKLDVSKFTLPNKFVVIATGYTSGVRAADPQVFSKIIDYCNSIGYEVVLLGNTKPIQGVEDLKFIKLNGNYINLIDKTTPVEALGILQNAACVIGMDNGLNNLAGLTDIPIVTGFTSVNPKKRNPYRNNILGYKCYNVVPDENICRYCQDSLYLLDHDFRNCYKETKECMKDLTFEKWKKQIDLALGVQ